MSYDQKIESARKIIDEHNENVDTDKKINWNDFLQALKNLGGTAEDTLKAAKWEDIESCGVPKMMASRIAHLFRQDSEGNGKKSAYVSDKKAAMLTVKELVERYNPKDVKNAVGKRLKDLSDKKPFIIFDDNGKIIVDESIKLLEDIQNGLPEVETAFVNGRPLPVYSVGERPDFYADENPVYPGRALRSNETCDQTGRSWQGVPVEIRQLLWLAVEETEELGISTVADAHDMLDKVLFKDMNLESLRGRYPVASKTLDEARKIGRLPLLKIKVGEKGSRSNNPFGSNTTF